MKYIVVYIDDNEVINSEDIPPKVASNNELLNQYIETMGVNTMEEFNKNSCKIAIIDFETNISFIAEINREITVKVSRTDY